MLNNYLSKYKELLQIGRDKLNGIVDNDVELHLLEDKDRLNEMLLLNQYVYTYYSTNRLDLTQSIEFIMLSEVVDDFVKCLDEKGYWYIYKKYSDETSVMKIGENNDKTIPELRTIHNEDLSRFRIKSSTQPNGWKITKKNGMYINLERLAKIHFLDNEMTSYLLEKYNKNDFAEYFDDDFEALYPYLTVIAIENPFIGKKDLYHSLVNILEPLCIPVLYE